MTLPSTADLNKMHWVVTDSFAHYVEYLKGMRRYPRNCRYLEFYRYAQGAPRGSIIIVLYKGWRDTPISKGGYLDKKLRPFYKIIQVTEEELPYNIDGSMKEPEEEETPSGEQVSLPWQAT